MSKFHMFQSFVAGVMLCQVDEVAEGTAPADGMQAAPGCETPKIERTVFPALTAAGGKFRSIPDATGAVHFDVNLVPMTTDDKGQSVPGLPEWPRQKDAEGNVIPLPWEGHNRLTNLALVKDCFDQDQGYFLYRAYEAYEKARIALDHYTEAKTGIAKSADKAAKKHATVLNSLNDLAAGLSDADKAQVQAVMELLNKMRSQPVGTVA